MRHLWKWVLAGLAFFWLWGRQPLWREMWSCWMPGRFPLCLRVAPILSRPMEDRLDPDLLVHAMNNSRYFPATFQIWLWRTIGDGVLNPGDAPLHYAGIGGHSTTMWFQAGVAGLPLLREAMEAPGASGPGDGVAVSKPVLAYYEQYLAERVHHPDRGILYDYLGLPYMFVSGGVEGGVRYLQSLDGSSVSSMQLGRVRDSMEVLGIHWGWDPWTQRVMTWRVSRPDLRTLIEAAEIINGEIATHLEQGRVFLAQGLIWPQWKAGLALMRHRLEPSVGRAGIEIMEGLLSSIPMESIPGEEVDATQGNSEAVTEEMHASRVGVERAVMRLRRVMLVDADDPKKQAVSQLASDTIEGLTASLAEDLPGNYRFRAGVIEWMIPLVFEQWLLLLFVSMVCVYVTDRREMAPQKEGPLPGLRGVYLFAGLTFWLWPMLFGFGVMAYGLVLFGQIIGLGTALALAGWVMHRAHGKAHQGWGLLAWAMWAAPGVCLMSFWLGLLLLGFLTSQFQELMLNWGL